MNLWGRLDEIRVGAETPDTQVLSFQDVGWHEINATYVTNQAGRSDLSLFSSDEGGQQEQLGIWLTDNLHPRGCVKSPQVHEKAVRELSDILLSYQYGAILIESKSLSILTRDNLPNREKLARDLSKHVSKASRQLIGGIKNLQKGLLVTDDTGAPLDINRESPVHAIILVPDLSLLGNASELGGDLIRSFGQTTGSFLHILDPAELLRVVQVAEMIAHGSERTSRMMAF